MEAASLARISFCVGITGVDFVCGTSHLRSEKCTQAAPGAFVGFVAPGVFFVPGLQPGNIQRPTSNDSDKPPIGYSMLVVFQGAKRDNRRTRALAFPRS